MIYIYHYIYSILHLSLYLITMVAHELIPLGLLVGGAVFGGSCFGLYTLKKTVIERKRHPHEDNLNVRPSYEVKYYNYKF